MKAAAAAAPGHRPVLVVEGHGDLEAVPLLVRRLFSEIGRPECTPAPRPLRCGDLPKLQRPGELEKFLTYACRSPHGDSVLVVVDCDDDCPPSVVDALAERALPLTRKFSRRVALCLMHREYETLFLYDAPNLSREIPRIPWHLEEWNEERDWTEVRDAKGKLRALMGGQLYKETRDQARFTSALDLAATTARCRSLRHLVSALRWLTAEGSPGLVYPSRSTR